MHGVGVTFADHWTVVCEGINGHSVAEGRNVLIFHGLFADVFAVGIPPQDTGLHLRRYGHQRLVRDVFKADSEEGTVPGSIGQFPSQLTGDFGQCRTPRWHFRKDIDGRRFLSV